MVTGIIIGFVVTIAILLGTAYASYRSFKKHKGWRAAITGVGVRPGTAVPGIVTNTGPQRNKATGTTPNVYRVSEPVTIDPMSLYMATFTDNPPHAPAVHHHVDYSAPVDCSPSYDSSSSCDSSSYSDCGSSSDAGSCGGGDM